MALVADEAFCLPELILCEEQKVDPRGAVPFCVYCVYCVCYKNCLSNVIKYIIPKSQIVNRMSIDIFLLSGPTTVVGQGLPVPLMG